MKISLSLCLAAVLVTSRAASVPELARLESISPELSPMLESFGGETAHHERVKRGEVTKLSAVAPDMTRLETISPDLLESFGADFDQLSESERVKRAGGIFSFVGNKLQSGISSIAHASSGLKSKIHGDDHGHGHGHGYEYGPSVESYDHKSFNLWGFKKAILHTLLQAVKAINGGIIAINGRIIKGTGYVVEAKGRILQHKGESIFQFGKGVANNALLSPPKTHGHFTGHLKTHADPHHHEEVYTLPIPSGHDAGYSHAGYASDDYSVQAAPLAASYASFGGSAPGSEYGAPHYQVARAVTAAPAPATKQAANNHYDDKGVKAGLLVLKPIIVSSYGEKTNAYSRSVQEPSDSFQQQDEEQDYQTLKRQAPQQEYRSSKALPEYQSVKRQPQQEYRTSKALPEYQSVKRQPQQEYRTSKALPEYQSAKRQAPQQEYRSSKALPEYQSAKRQAPQPEYRTSKSSPAYQAQAPPQASYQSTKRQAPPLASYQSPKRQASSSLYLAPSRQYSVFAAPPPMYEQPSAADSSSSFSALPPPAAFYRPYSLEHQTYDPALGYALPSVEYE